jgi:Domain of unknown function (DUF6754)
MNSSGILNPEILGLAFLLVFIGVYLFFRYALPARPEQQDQAGLRRLSAFHRLRKAIGWVLENGNGIHLSSGSGGVNDARGASGLISLVMLHRIIQKSAKSDQLPLATSGDGALTALSQDVLHSSYKAAGSERTYDPAQGQVTGITPFSYVAGTMLATADHPLQANLLAGHFGSEAALIADAADRSGQLTVAGSDGLPAQAAFLAAADETLIGEELFAGGAYLQAGRAHQASLLAQDALRWLIILLILAGVVLKLLGVL